MRTAFGLVRTAHYAVGLLGSGIKNGSHWLPSFMAKRAYSSICDCR